MDHEDIEMRRKIVSFYCFHKANKDFIVGFRYAFRRGFFSRNGLYDRRVWIGRKNKETNRYVMRKEEFKKKKLSFKTEWQDGKQIKIIGLALRSRCYIVNRGVDCSA